MVEKIDWVLGDSLGLSFPAHGDALSQGGLAFLNQAFHASGVLPAHSKVLAITQLQEVTGGSTGRKFLLSVEYDSASPELVKELFVKFSRDFDDERRDQGRGQMEREVLLALLSRDPAFPIAVPTCYFSDFHHASGTGILITQRVGFGEQEIEPLYPKCLDYQMPDQLGHYQAIVRALAQLAGTHKSGRLGADVERYFPFDPAALVVSRRKPYTPEQISKKVQQYKKLVQVAPQLFPENIRSAAFLVRLANEAPQMQGFSKQGNHLLQSDPNMIALCHWNAHVDNAWFWRDEQATLQCGLMDWGNVSQMNLAMALWGCLSGAELDIWDQHLDALLMLFCTEFRNSGGADLNLDQLKFHLTVYVAMMGLAWMLDVPQGTLLAIPEIENVKDRHDPLIAEDERVRSQLLILTAVLNLWQKTDMEALMDRLKG